jgi:hypothetical protein
MEVAVWVCALDKGVDVMRFGVGAIWCRAPCALQASGSYYLQHRAPCLEMQISSIRRAEAPWQPTRRGVLSWTHASTAVTEAT